LAWLSVILSDPTTDFTVRVFPVLIPDTFEKKSYLVLAPLLIKFFDVRLFLYFQKFLALLGLYFCKEISAAPSKYAFSCCRSEGVIFYLILFLDFYCFFYFSLFLEICKTEMHPPSCAKMGTLARVFATIAVDSY
jgi:hypothetical protein